MKLKNQVRDNNVDLTRSTMQKKINSLLKQINLHNQSSRRKNLKLSKHNHLFNKLISEGKLTRLQVKEFMKHEKSTTNNS